VTAATVVAAELWNVNSEGRRPRPNTVLSGGCSGALAALEQRADQHQRAVLDGKPRLELPWTGMRSTCLLSIKPNAWDHAWGAERKP